MYPIHSQWLRALQTLTNLAPQSQNLLSAIKEYENNKWKVIGQKVGKPAKACEQHAKEHWPGKLSTIDPPTQRWLTWFLYRPVSSNQGALETIVSDRPRSRKQPPPHKVLPKQTTPDFWLPPRTRCPASMVSAIITHPLRQWGLGPAGATFGLDGRCSERGKQNSLSPLVPHGHEWRCSFFFLASAVS